MIGRRQFLQFAAGGALAAGPRQASAQTYPTRPITLSVFVGAGGGPDIVARLLGQALSQRLGQPVVIENRPGGGGNLALLSVARAPADGYTLLLTATPHAVNVTLYPKQEISILRDIVPIASIDNDSFAMVVNPSLPAKTVPEFIAYAKANPGKLNFTVAGTQNISHLAPVLLFARAGIDLVMVPAKSEPQAVSDLMAGQVDLYFGNSSSLLPHINSDKIRLIAVGTAQRIPAAPDIPAVAETLPGFEFASWNGFSAPAETPEPIIATIRREIAAFAKSPEISERLSKLGIVPGGLGKDETAAVFKKDYESFAAAVKAAGITPQ